MTPAPTLTSSEPAAATKAGVLRIALTPSALHGYTPTAAADESIADTSYDMCNRGWNYDEQRVAQFDRQWTSPTHVLLDDLRRVPDGRGQLLRARGQRRARRFRPAAVRTAGEGAGQLAGDDDYLLEIKVAAAAAVIGSCAGASEPKLEATAG